MKKESKVVKVKGVKIGGSFPPVVQGMAKTDILDVEATVDQIKEIRKAGAELVRIAVPNIKSARVISRIKQMVDVPLAADVHFNYRLALEAIDQGIDKVRINPGNMNPRDIAQVARKAGECGVPLRVGVNSGSLPRGMLQKISELRDRKEEKCEFIARSMVDVALDCVNVVEKNGMEDIVISLKSPEIPVTVLANRIIAEKSIYPLHIGVTATGPPPAGLIKSAIGLGVLLSEGLGDTIRVSLTADPVEEVRVAYQILRYMGIIDESKPILVACPTCGRCRGDVRSLAKEVLDRIGEMDFPLKIAVMGCEVNGPGEAMEADLGIACTRGGGILFKKGHPFNRVKREEMVNTLLKEIYSMKQGKGE